MSTDVFGQSDQLDQILVSIRTYAMKMLTVSKAKAEFSGVIRRVIKTREPVVVRAPSGFVQIIPYDIPEEVPPAVPGSWNPLPREIKMQNEWGETS